MQILSAPSSTFVTRVLPFIVVAGACGWAYWPKRNEGAEPLVLALIFLVIATLIMYRTLRKSAWRRADTVEDRGDRLVITRWKTTIEVPLSQVQQVLRVSALGGMEVIIILKTPGALGSQIACSFLRTSEESQRLNMLWRCCRAEFHRGIQDMWPNKRIEFAPFGRPIRKQLCCLLAAHSRR